MGIVDDYESAMISDINELDIGKIVDFCIDDEFEIKYFILEGNEDMIKSELEISGSYKLLMSPKLIKKKENKEIQLNTIWRDLESIERIPSDVVKFHNLRNIDVIDSDHENIGRILDAIVHVDNHVSFVIGGSPLREFFKRIGIVSKVHLLLPYRYIERMDSNLVKISKTKDDLGKVLNDIVLDADGMRIFEAKDQASYESRLSVFKEAYQDVLQAEKRGN